MQIGFAFHWFPGELALFGFSSQNRVFMMPKRSSAAKSGSIF
jgi:hypothetical protein